MVVGEADSRVAQPPLAHLAEHFAAQHSVPFDVLSTWCVIPPHLMLFLLLPPSFPPFFAICKKIDAAAI